MKWLAALLFIGLAAAAFVLPQIPKAFEAEDASRFASGNKARGEAVFWAGGCASCHAADGATGDAKLVLAGGHALKTPFGTFVAPNISTHASEGIGDWSALDFASAMKRGIAPGGHRYYPAFPYTQYARMSDIDVADLWAYMQTLPVDPTPSQPHDLPFPVNIRAGLALWQLLHLDEAPVTAQSADPLIERGRYLVEGPAHCGACHTPRGVTGGLDHSRWLAGAP
ncbi:MAG: cytochrome c, partial [Pseudomonadota bacterium]